MNDQAFSELNDLLAELFDGQLKQLLRWARLNLGQQIANGLPDGSVGLAELAFQITLAIRSHGRVDRALFESLRRIRPAQTAAIDRVAALCRVQPETSANGNETAEPAANATAATGAQPVRLSSAQCDRLVELFVACDSMSTTASRDAIVLRLDDIAQFIRRNSVLKFDVDAIVNTCAARDGGIETLVQATKSFEGSSRYMQAIENYLAGLRADALG